MLLIREFFINLICTETFYLSAANFWEQKNDCRFFYNLLEVDVVRTEFR